MEGTLSLPAVRVLRALNDHTMVDVIAAAAEVSLPQTIKILEELERQGRVARFTDTTWGKR